MTKAQKIAFIQKLIVALDLKYSPLGQGGVDEAAVNALIEQYNINHPSSREAIHIDTYIDNPPGLNATQVQSLIDTSIAARISENNSPQQVIQQVYVYNQDVPVYTGLYEFADTSNLSFADDTQRDGYYKYIDDVTISKNKVFITGVFKDTQNFVVSFDVDSTTKTLSNMTKIAEIPVYGHNDNNVTSIAVTPNGTRLLVYRPGMLQTYDLIGGTWTYICEINVNVNVKKLSINAIGSILMFAGDSNRVVREYRLSAYGAWEWYTDNTIDYQQFDSLTISADGLRAIGVDNTTKSIVEYVRPDLNSPWVQTVKTYADIAILSNIRKVSLSVTNNKLLCSYDGGVAIFLRQDSGEWYHEGNMTSQDADASKQFGMVVAMSPDGKTVVCKNSNVNNVESTSSYNRLAVYKSREGTTPVIPAGQVIQVTEGDYRNG